MPRLKPQSGRLEFTDRLPAEFCVHDQAVKDLVASLTTSQLTAELARLKAAPNSWRTVAGAYLIEGELERRERA